MIKFDHFRAVGVIDLQDLQTIILLCRCTDHEESQNLAKISQTSDFRNWQNFQRGSGNHFAEFEVVVDFLIP